MKSIHVVAAIIKKDNQYLIVQRNKNKHLGLKYEFPGGKIELGESKEQAVIREIDEELNLKIKPIILLIPMIKNILRDSQAVGTCINIILKDILLLGIGILQLLTTKAKFFS